MNEIWIDVKGYKTEYKVSNLGRVKSLARVFIRSNGRRYTVKEKYLACGVDKSTGYPIVSLTHRYKSERIRLHVLVARHFVPNPRNLPEVNHKDTNKQNPKASNLEWVTHLQNCQHAVKHRLFPRKYADELRQQLATDYAIGDCSFQDLANKYDIANKVTVYRLVKSYEKEHNIERASEVKRKVKYT